MDTSTAISDPLEHVRVGDHDPDPASVGCDASQEGLRCTRYPGHPGQHIACSSKVLATWPAS